jgi:Phage gp6-like head-tail connector protein
MVTSITNGLCSFSDLKLALGIQNSDQDVKIARAVGSASRLIETTCNRRFWQDPPARVDSVSVTEGSDTVLDSTITAADVGRWATDNTSAGAIQALSVVQNVVPGVSFQLANVVNQNPLPAVASSDSVTIGLVPRRFVTTSPWLCVLEEIGGGSSYDISTLNGLIVQTDYVGDGSFTTTWATTDYQAEPVNALMGAQPWPFTQLRAIDSQYFPIWGGLAYPQPLTQDLVMVTAQWGWPAIPETVNEACILEAMSIFKSEDVPFGATPFSETGVIRLKTDLHPTSARLLAEWIEDSVFCL